MFDVQRCNWVFPGKYRNDEGWKCQICDEREAQCEILSFCFSCCHGIHKTLVFVGKVQVRVSSKEIIRGEFSGSCCFMTERVSHYWYMINTKKTRPNPGPNSGSRIRAVLYPLVLLSCLQECGRLRYRAGAGTGSPTWTATVRTETDNKTKEYKAKHACVGPAYLNMLKMKLGQNMKLMTPFFPVLQVSWCSGQTCSPRASPSAAPSPQVSSVNADPPWLSLNTQTFVSLQPRLL